VNLLSVILLSVIEKPHGPTKTPKGE